eukprot:7641462-Pyramimonas_sp.AAC.1
MLRLCCDCVATVRLKEPSGDCASPQAVLPPERFNSEAPFFAALGNPARPQSGNPAPPQPVLHLMGEAFA